MRAQRHDPALRHQACSHRRPQTYSNKYVPQLVLGAESDMRSPLPASSPPASKIGSNMDDDQSALLSSMHALMLRRGTDTGEFVLTRRRRHLIRPVDAVVQQYLRDVEVLQEAQHFM